MTECKSPATQYLNVNYPVARNLETIHSYAKKCIAIELNFLMSILNSAFIDGSFQLSGSNDSNLKVFDNINEY